MASSTSPNTSYRIYISAETVNDHNSDDHFTFVFKVFRRQSLYGRTSFAAKSSFVDLETSTDFTRQFDGTKASVSTMLSSIEAPFVLSVPLARETQLYWADRGSGTSRVTFDALVSKIFDAAGSGKPDSRLLVTMEKRVVVAVRDQQACKRLSRDRVFPRSMDLVSLEKSFSMP